MPYELNGKTIETNANGYINDLDEWNKDLAGVIASEQEVELTEKSWDVINYLRDEYFNNGGNQPNERHMIKYFKALWTDMDKVDSKTLYTLFPRGPAKQAGMIAGLPETKRKGGY
ncbi:MAG: TusE/DsrC/DsvC family sulfur relay protein [Gammaproteobacteria bacterium]|nr:TusE/DsrC/DsvC family sulfur relay protein [Gammaproteobacteria bacterium]